MKENFSRSGVCSLKFFLSKTSNESTDFDDPQVVHEFQVFDDTKVISNGSMYFDNPKVSGYIYPSWMVSFYYLLKRLLYLLLPVVFDSTARS